jgi:hypothetical protein
MKEMMQRRREGQTQPEAPQRKHEPRGNRPARQMMALNFNFQMQTVIKLNS